MRTWIVAGVVVAALWFVVLELLALFVIPAVGVNAGALGVALGVVLAWVIVLLGVQMCVRRLEKAGKI